MKTRIPLTLFLCSFCLLASSQIFVKVSLPQSLEQCQGLPVEISITNEGRTPVRNADIQFFTSSYFRFRANSLTGKSVVPVNTGHPAGPQFRLLDLDICETTSFQFWMDHACSAQGHQDAFYATFNWNGLQIRTDNLNAQIYSPQVSITNLGLYYDETVKRFKKKFTIVNIGQVVMDSFSLFIVGDDKMRILNTNIGQLSASGDTLHFSRLDFNQYGNLNDYFEPGESLTIIQDIQVNACETEFKINHKLLVPCGLQTCEFSIEENIKLLAIVGNPTLIVAQDTQTYASPCRDGEIQLKLRNESKTGTFDLGNSMYNLVLDLGWALIRNGQFTEPLQDNCLKIISAKVGGKTIPLSTTGFTGYGLDFKRLNMDPDGPGGLDDLDNDGFYDDLLPGDSIELTLIYEMDRNCLRLDCDDVVFERRTFRLDAAFNNYCNKPGTYEGYISNHTYYWNRPSVSALRFQSIYVDEEKDTVEFYLQKNLYHFLEDCDTDSTVVRITLPAAAEFIPGSVILVNGLPIAYRKNANVISFNTDTSNFRVKIPLVFHCDPASGSGGVNTDCTFCLGSGGPRFNIRIEADYYCNSCYQRIPLYCGSTPAFPVICDTTVVGTASPGKLVIQDMTFKRLTTGYTDSTKTVRVDPDLDSLKHDFFLPYDTFLLYIPIDVLCDASFNNILFKLAIAPRYFYVNGVLDTIKEITWLSDTLKFFDGETNRWSSCVNPMGVEYYSQNTNNFYHYYLREMNMSALFGNCLRGSLSTRDSMVFVIKGVINHFDQYQWVKSTLYSELVYNQDGCNMQVRKSATLNILSGKPSGGSTFLRQEYFSDPNLKRVSPYLS
ncbi:MAG TPA: hypothetical protein VFX48_02450, partial [Saprospiraceae bacterium]|nr:hypothetical protein [Saprospiraceae bacterium]